MKKSFLLSAAIIGSLSTASMSMDQNSESIVFEKDSSQSFIKIKVNILGSENSLKMGLDPILLKKDQYFGLDWEKVKQTRMVLEKFDPTNNRDGTYSILTNVFEFFVYCLDTVTQIDNIKESNIQDFVKFFEDCKLIQHVGSSTPKKSKKKNKLIPFEITNKKTLRDIALNKLKERVNKNLSFLEAVETSFAIDTRSFLNELWDFAYCDVEKTKEYNNEELNGAKNKLVQLINTINNFSINSVNHSNINMTTLCNDRTKDIKALYADLEKLDKKHITFEQTISEKSNEIEKLHRQIKTQKELIEELNKKVETKQKDYDQNFEKMIRKIDPNNNTSKKKINKTSNGNNSKQEKNTEQLENLKNKIKNLENSISKYKENTKILTEENHNLRSNIKEKNILENEISKLKNELKKNSSNQIEQKTTNLKKEITELQKKLFSTEEKNKTLETCLDQEKKRQELVQQSQSETISFNDELSRKNKELLQENEKLHEELKKESLRTSSLTKVIEMTENLVKNNENTNKEKQELISQKNKELISENKKLQSQNRNLIEENDNLANENKILLLKLTNILPNQGAVEFGIKVTNILLNKLQESQQSNSKNQTSEQLINKDKNENISLNENPNDQN